MPELIKVTNFSISEDGKYVAVTGGLTIEFTGNGSGKWSVGIDEYENILVPPCDEDYFDTPACEAGKDLDEVENFDACELTCPYVKRAVEQLRYSYYHWCESLEDSVLDARKALLAVDEQYSDRCYTPELADMILDTKWRIGGELY